MISQKLKIRKVGNSHGVILPAEMLHSLSLSSGSDIEVTVEEGVIIICPPPPKLDYLLSTVPKGEVFTELSTGKSVGKEE